MLVKSSSPSSSLTSIKRLSVPSSFKCQKGSSSEVWSYEFEIGAEFATKSRCGQMNTGWLDERSSEVAQHGHRELRERMASSAVANPMSLPVDLITVITDPPIPIAQPIQAVAMFFEVQLAVNEAFDVASSVDDSTHHFAFSDGVTAEGRLCAHIEVLWVKNESLDFHLHTHGLSQILRFDERMVMIRACDVPDGARIRVRLIGRGRRKFQGGAGEA